MSIATEARTEVLPTFPEVSLGHDFARRFPELALPWQAAPAPDPRVAVLNTGLAEELGLDPEALATPEGAQFLIGRSLASGSEPVAQLYSGHQFGVYSPMLGDGRALLLGEVHASDGRTFDLHLKGSGRTPPARGDGFAALGPMLREYLVGEAMHALGVPSTRALAVVTTGREVFREDFLHDDRLPGAVLVRVASSHLRVGTFQLARARGDRALLGRLARFAIRRHYPWHEASEHPARALFREVVRAQATLTAQWMLVGFVHGVVNTDNVTISGETIDYGPCAFLDAYDPTAVFSSIDHGGRYAFGGQPSVTKWNLARFAEALLPLLADTESSIDEDRATERAVEAAKAELEGFDRHFARAWSDGMSAKLGLVRADYGEIRDLAEELLALLAEGRIDYTNAFRGLTDAAADRARIEAACDLLAGTGGQPGVDESRRERARAWLERWERLDPRAESMRRANPVTIPRNHLLAGSLDSATDGDLAPFQEMLAAATHPFEERNEWRRFADAPPNAGRFVTTCGT